MATQVKIESVEHIESLWQAESARRAAGQWPENFPPLPEIPVNRYVSKEFAQLERDHVWRQSWIFVAHESELPERGCYLTRDLAGVPMIVIRDADGTIRAFHNVCQHRGARLLQAESGKTDSIICPYHCWSYSLGGTLRFIPEACDFPHLEKDGRKLAPIHCRNYRGLIFISVLEDPQPLEVFLGAMTEALADVPLESAHVIRRVVLPAACNWKCVHDAFSETYHVRFVHAQSVNLAIDPHFTARYMMRGGHNGMVVKARLEDGSNLVNVFDRGGSADTGEQPGALLPITRQSQRSYNIFPNLTVPIAENLFPILAAWPVSEDRCDVEIRFLKLADGAGSAESDAAVIEAFLAIAGEDLAALAGIQTSMAGGGLKTMVLGYGEQFIANFHLEVDRMIGPQALPPAFRVPPVELPLVG